jgi:hypothetical protein
VPRGRWPLRPDEHFLTETRFDVFVLVQRQSRLPAGHGQVDPREQFGID